MIWEAHSVKTAAHLSDALEHNRITRRRFLHVSLAAAGGVIALGAPRGSAGQERGQVRWAFLSDTHVAGDPQNNYRGHYPYRNLEKTFTQIAADLPEGLVVTGDIARLTGQMEDYENFKRLLVPLVGRRPIYLALGNHDHRGNCLDAFEIPAGPRPAVKDKHIVTVDAGTVRFILLDSLFATNQTMGLLGKAQRTWLERYLATCDDKPVLLFFHHSLRDSDGDLIDLPRLFDIIEPIRKVKALVYGHSHEYAYSQFEGIHLINLPAVGYNFGDDQPVGWVEAQLTRDGGTFLLHAVGGNDKLDGRAERLSWRS
jgi:3',5'-cyclic AMP phosphodiesterase CpdA